MNGKFDDIMPEWIEPDDDLQIKPARLKRIHARGRHGQPQHGCRVCKEMATDHITGEPVAWDRDETDSCERGTPGCSIHHTRDSDCQTW